MKEKILNIVLKVLFPLEFITANIWVWLLYATRTTKTYSGYWSRNLLIFLVPITMIVIALIVLNCIKNKNTIEKLFLGFMIPIGLCYLVFMLPEYVPDENAHLYKSYEISQGQLITPIDENGKSHTDIPKEFTQPCRKYQDLNRLLLTHQTDYEDKKSVINPAQNYHPILYTFSSIGLKIGKALGMNGILIQYVARTFNYIVFLLLAYLAIQKIPFGKLVLSMYLFMPMVLQQAVSISADSLINSVILFYIAYLLHLFFRKEEMKKYEIALCILLSVFVGITKIVYFPLVGMTLFFLFKKNLPQKQKRIFVITSIVVTMITTCTWYLFSLKYTANEKYLMENNVNAKEQIKGVLTNPIHGINVIRQTIKIRGESYFFTLIGSNLGWLDIGIPIIKITGFLVLIVLAVFFEKNEVSLSGKQRIWLLCIGSAIFVLTLMALYTGWTGVGKESVEGVQGRYFIPIAILPLLCCAMKENYVKIKHINKIMFTLVSYLSLSVMNNIYQFFI